MTHGSLFSGIGGFDLAAEWMGWDNVFHCEWNEFGQKVLKHYWPKAISYADITKTDFTIHKGTIDILTGGFPCQPYSMAGKRKGKDDERHLWPQMLRAIREIRPRWVVGENVFGLVNWSGGLVFHEVQTDLEAEGYEVFPYVLPAAAVNAPHRRDRVWFVAYAIGSTKRPSGKSRGVNCNRSNNDTQPEEWRNETKQHTRCANVSQNAPHSNSNGLNQCDREHEINTSEGGFDALGNINESNGNGNATDTDNSRLKTFNSQKSIMGQKNRTKTFSGNCTQSLCTGLQWETFPTQSPICSRNDGLPTELDGITFSKWRNESIKAAGNAIVPQVVFQIFKTIEQYETQRPDPQNAAKNQFHGTPH